MQEALQAGRLSGAELSAWRGLLRVHASLVRALDAELEADHALPITSYDVLTNLEGAPEQRMRMRDLAEAIVLSRSGLTRLVDRLEKEGLVKRAACASDARGSFACLTEAGHAALERARPTHLDGVRRRFLAHFDADELEQLGAYWERVLPGASAAD